MAKGLCVICTYIHPLLLVVVLYDDGSKVGKMWSLHHFLCILILLLNKNLGKKMLIMG
jgi:hypothetical protein